MDFTNTKVHGIHKSRYLASYYNSIMAITRWGERSIKIPHFGMWLNELVFPDGTKLSEDEQEEIYAFAMCGKMEFEHNAIRFIQSKES